MDLGPSKHIDFAPLVTGELDNDMRGGSEAVEAQALTGPDVGQPQRAVADDAGAEQGSGLQVRKLIGQPVGKGFGNKGGFGVSYVKLLVFL